MAGHLEERIKDVGMKSQKAKIASFDKKFAALIEKGNALRAERNAYLGEQPLALCSCSRVIKAKEVDLNGVLVSNHRAYEEGWDLSYTTIRCPACGSVLRMDAKFADNVAIFKSYREIYAK